MTRTATALPKWQRSAEALRAHWLAAVAKGYYPYAFFRELGLSPRLLRLFAVACCRHPLIDGLLTDPRSSTAVEVAERHADGLCTDAALRQAWHDGWAARDDLRGAAAAAAAATAATAARAAAHTAHTATAAATAATDAAAHTATAAATAARAATLATLAARAAAHAATDAATADAADAAAHTAAHTATAAHTDAATDAAATAAHTDAAAAAAAARAAMREYQGGLLVSLVGPGWEVAPAWRTHTAVALASHIYEAREWVALPILADALQDAGCEDTLILEPLRDPAGVWFRGCRLLDELLGKREGRDRA